MSDREDVLAELRALEGYRTPLEDKILAVLEQPAEGEYQKAYEIWKAWGQRANEALQEIWKMAVPGDTSHMTYGDDPQAVVEAARAALQGTEYAVRILWAEDGEPQILPMRDRFDALSWRPQRTPWSYEPVLRRVGAWEADTERPTDEEFREIAKARYSAVQRTQRGAVPWDRLTESAQQREIRIAVSAWEYRHETEEA